MTGSHTDGITGRIFDIQHCSLDDGPGIRTAVFFKGCNLGCRWCHNPESLSAKPMLAYKANMCRFCKLCAEACEFGVHKFSRSGDIPEHQVLFEKCTACGKCVDVCCFDALEMVGKDYTIDDLLREIRIDQPYYSVGEWGGVTFSGGEPMLQFDFIESFIDSCEGIHMCIETAGHVPQIFFQKMISKIDLFLFDYKATDPEKHKELCGVDNELILSNLDFLYRNGASIILRLPLIPGVNDDDQHLQSIADLLKKYPKIPYGQIMPYHNLGVGKQSIYNIDEPVLDLPSASEEQKKIWLNRLKSFGADRIKIS